MFKKLVGLLTVVVAGLVFTGTASAQITGSAHDFSQLGAFNSGGEICIACHTTHNSITAVAANAPLWNHTLTSNGDFLPYTGFDMQSTPAATVNTASLLCLSCHDGTVALDSYGGGAAAAGFIDATHNVSKDLTNDHPISMDYPATDTGLKATTASSSLGGTIASDYLVGGTAVECSSCHNVHNDAGGGPTSLLKLDNAGSALCLECHAK